MAAGTAAVAVIADHSGPHVTTWQLAPALFAIGAGMGLVFVPMTPFIVASVDPHDAGSASGTANAVQQIGGALGIAVAGEVFFRELAATSYGHAFGATAVLQIALLATGAVLTLLLPRRITPGAYQQHH
jgi:MFS family permease